MEEVTRTKENLISWMEENKEAYYQLSEKIWDKPELSMQEHASSKLLSDYLTQSGFTVETGVAGMPTAFIAKYGSGNPVIGINVEFDALPGLSQEKGSTVHDPIREGAPGHGCGHNLLGPAAVKAGVGLKTVIDENQLSGTIVMLGVPAEELCLGKSLFGKAGLLDDIDVFLDWHPWSYNRVDYDSCNAYFNVKYHFTGRSSHGNSPWHGRSSLDAAILQTHGVEMLREHIYPGNPPDAANTINYTISDPGSEFPSVVPDRTTVWYVGRFNTTEEAQDALRRVTNCAKGAALSTETQVETEIIAATHHKIPNKTLSKAMHDNFQLIGPPEFSKEEQELAKRIQRELGVEETGLPVAIRDFNGGYSVVCDTSEYSWNGPYATAWVGMAPENTGWHNWGVTLCASGSTGQKSMDKAAVLIGLTGIDLLLSKELVDTSQKEFKERMGEQSYQCLLPDGYKVPVDLNADLMKKYES